MNTTTTPRRRMATVSVREAAWRAGVAGTAPAALAAFASSWPDAVCGSATNPRVVLAALDGGPAPVDVVPAQVRTVRLQARPTVS